MGKGLRKALQWYNSRAWDRPSGGNKGRDKARTILAHLQRGGTLVDPDTDAQIASEMRAYLQLPTKSRMLSDREQGQRTRARRNRSAKAARHPIVEREYAKGDRDMVIPSAHVVSGGLPTLGKKR